MLQSVDGSIFFIFMAAGMLTDGLQIMLFILKELRVNDDAKMG